ncbi:MAG: ATP synthase F1 subunit delta [Clostridiales bacterium]|nr:ATP synthase F1 subunit delta [Clostridiales bacterium]
MALKDKRYAEALISIASEQNALEEYQRELSDLSGIYMAEDTYREFLLDPGTDKAKKNASIEAVFKGRIRPELVSLLKLLSDKGSISSLPGISRNFAQMADEKRNILNIEITAFEPLENAQLELLSEKFRKQYNAASVKATMTIDKKLLGGIRVRIGDKLIDGSAAGSLRTLKGLLAK